MLLDSTTLCHPERRKSSARGRFAESRDPASAGTRQEIEGSSLQELCFRTNTWREPSRKQEQTPATSGSFDCGNELAPESVPPAQDDNLKRGTQQTTANLRMSCRIAASALQNAVILRQRSPWQSQGLPTKDLCTPRDGSTFAQNVRMRNSFLIGAQTRCVSPPVLFREGNPLIHEEGTPIFLQNPGESGNLKA